MKTNRFIAVFLILVSLLALSCNITHNAEGAVEAVIATPTRILRGVQGNSLGIPANTSGYYSNKGYHFTIKLTKGSFAALAAGSTLPGTQEPSLDGITYTVYKAVKKGDTSMIVEVSGTLPQDKVGEFPIKLTLPGSAFSPTHYSDVEVRTNENLKFDILDRTEPYAILDPSDTTSRNQYYADEYVSGATKSTYRLSFDTKVNYNALGSSTQATISIFNDDFNTNTTGDPQLDWLNAPTDSVYLTTSIGISSARSNIIFFAYRTDENSKPCSFYADNIVIPSEYVKSNRDVKVINLYYSPIDVYDSYTSAFIESKTESASTASPFNTTVTFNLNGGKVYNKINKDADLSSYVVLGKVPGLSYRAVGSEIGDTKIQMYITGTPLQSGTFEMQFNIPASTYAADNVGRPYGEKIDGTYSYQIPVSGTLTIDVEAGDFYDYKLYDLATFGTVEATTTVISPNAGLTTDKDGNALVYETPASRYILKSEHVDNQKLPITVTYEPGLKRRGYTLKGFSRRLPGDSAVDITRVDYPVSDPNNISFTLDPSDKGNSISLYAIWEVNPADWGWTKNANGTYQKTQDISDGGKYLPAVFDVEKAYPDTTDDQGAKVDNSELRSHYENYPYYKEAHVLAKDLYVPGVVTSTGTYYNDLADVQLSYDFAIGEQVITGYMLDVLRDWNTTLSKGYDIPTEFTDTTSAPTGVPTAGDTTNQVGYGARYEGGNTKANNEKSEPITYVTVSQSMVIANAMSAYYNDKKGLSNSDPSYLDPAYVSADGTEIKTLVAADTIINALTSSDAGKVLAKAGAKGFRLPTAEEWGLAARIVPESSYSTDLTGAHTTETGTITRNYMYPQLTRSNMWSGDSAIASNASQNTLADKYVWYVYNSSIVGQNLGASHGFIKYAIENKVSFPGTVLDKAPNNIGVYGMSGNVWEWCDQTVVNGSSVYRRLRGGSFGYTASGTRVGCLSGISPSYRLGSYGLRLARSV